MFVNPVWSGCVVVQSDGAMSASPRVASMAGVSRRAPFPVAPCSRILQTLPGPEAAV
jgi:hypothetical protein